MDTTDPKVKQMTISWIASLAITITCCAIQFVVFAGYIFDLKQNIIALKIRNDILEQRVTMANIEIGELTRRASVQQIQLVPSPTGTSIQIPVSILPAQQNALPPAKH